MPIVGDRPESGVRIAIERRKSAETAPWIYEGAAHLPQATFAVRVVVEESGEVRVTIEDEGDDEGATAPPDLADKVRLIVRTVFRQAQADGEPPAWRIVRWRRDRPG